MVQISHAQLFLISKISFFCILPPFLSQANVKVVIKFSLVCFSYIFIIFYSQSRFNLPLFCSRMCYAVTGVFKTLFNHTHYNIFHKMASELLLSFFSTAQCLFSPSHQSTTTFNIYTTTTNIKL